MYKYFSFFIRGIKIFYEYPQRFFIVLLNSIIAIMLLSVIWSNFVGGDFVEYVKYFAVTELIILALWTKTGVLREMVNWSNSGWHFIMLKPLNVLYSLTVYSIGKRFVCLLISIFLAIVLLMFFGFNASLSTILLFSILFILIIIFDSLIGYILGGISFFTYRIWGFSVLYNGAEASLGGGIAPLWIFPSWALGFLGFLPFAYKIFYPAQFLLTGELQYFVKAFLGLIIWIIVFFIIGYIINKKGMEKFESQGG